MPYHPAPIKAEVSKSIAHLIPPYQEQEGVIIIIANIKTSNQAEQTSKSEAPPGSYAQLQSKDNQGKEADPVYISVLFLLPQQKQQRNLEVLKTT